MLVANLPQGARLLTDQNADAAWTLTDVLLAVLVNNLRGYIWGMSDKRKRGPEPKPIGPSWMTAGKKRSLPARVLPIDELMKELNKPRSKAHGR